MELAVHYFGNKFFVGELGNESARKRNFFKISFVVGSFQHVICWWPKTAGEKQKPRKESSVKVARHGRTWTVDSKLYKDPGSKLCRSTL